MLKLVVCAGVLAVSAAEETLSNPATAAPLLGAVADPVAKAALEVAFAQIGELRDELRMTRIELAQERAERDMGGTSYGTAAAASRRTLGCAVSFTGTGIGIDLPVVYGSV